MDPKMDSKRPELGIMGPPPTVPHSSNSRPDAHPLPASSSSANARTAAPPRRIIKTINLDFKKLKEAGLDRKLAEVLSKQSPAARAGIPHSPSSSSSSSVATQSSCTSAATMTAAAASAEAASTSLHSQHQQLHQPELPQTAVKRIKISDSMEKTVPILTPPVATTSSNLERTMHVKAMLKNRILNKCINTSTQIQQPKPMPAPKIPPTAAQGSAPRSGGSSNAATAAPTSGAFTIPKADLSVRPKHPPLLLNLVNQLPKHRTMCMTTDDIELRNQQELLQQKAFERHPPPQQKQPKYQPQSLHISMQKSSQNTPHIPIQNSLQNQTQSPKISMQKSSQNPQHNPIKNPPQAPTPIAAANELLLPPPEASIISQKSPSPPPLIVLENKVLAPNEKIDLSNLRLPSNTSIVATIVKTKAQPLAQTIIKGGKVIMNASKFKVPREKLAEMAQEIRNQAKQVKQNTQPEAAGDSSTATTKIPTTIPKEIDPKQQASFTQSTVEATDLTSLTSGKPKPMSLKNTKMNTATALDQEELPQDENTESSYMDSSVNTPEQETPKVVINTEASFLDLPIHISTDRVPKELNKSADFEQEKPKKPTSTSSQEIPKSSATAEASSPVSKVQSAVDFIAQLTAEHSLDESSFMELSPEEQSLNALFGGSFTGVPTQNAEKEKEPAEEVGSLKVTRSSPKKLSEEEELPIGKIMKMDDMDILHATLDVKSDSTNILRISPNAIKLRSSVDQSGMELPAATSTEIAVPTTNEETLVVATSTDKGDQTSGPDMSQKPVAEEASKGSLENQIKPVTDSAKEVNPPAKRLPLRSKKAKINLVQRNKRPSMPNKFLDSKKTKLDGVVESGEEATTAIMDHSLLEEIRPSAGVQGIEVPTNVEQEVRESEGEQQGVSQSKEDKEQQGVRKSKNDEERQEVRESKDDEEGQEVRKSKADEENQEVREFKEVDEHEVRDSKEDELQRFIESTEDEPKKASNPAKDTKTKTQTDTQNSAKSSIERDLTQLYHPPKMPKMKTNKKNNNQEALEHTQTAKALSIIEILSQEQPPPQGDAKLPFRKESPTEVNLPESTGIQNLVTHLTAERVTPQTKKKLSTSPPDSGETAKGMPRKKRMKTRPVLSKRTSARKQEEIGPEFLHPISPNAGGGRIPTSSTSDDDGTVFLGFNNKEEKRSKTPVRSKRVRQMRINETDISDDATPDYDETEEEQQKPVDKDIISRRKDQVSDSDSSDCPMDFGDNPTNEDTSLDTTLVSIEAESSKQIKWDDLKGASKEPILDAANLPEQLEALNEPEQSETVINEIDLTVDYRRSSRSRKSSRKPSPTAKKINSEEPSTSKGALKISEAKEKLLTKPGSVEGSTPKAGVQTTVEKEYNLVSNEIQKELRDVEESVTSTKSEGKRRSRSSNATDSNQAEDSQKTENNSEQKEDKSKIPEAQKEPVNTNEKRITRTALVSKTVIEKKEEIVLTNSENSNEKRASRRQTKSNSSTSEITELVPISKPSEHNEAIKTRASRQSRSRTPAQPITKSDKTDTDTNTQSELEELKATEEPSSSKDAGSFKRQMRNRKSTVALVAKDELNLDKELKNTDSQNPQEVQAAEEPEHSLNSKRKSRSRVTKITDSDVGKKQKNTTSQVGSQEENKAAEKPKTALTCEENKVSNPKNVDATEDEEKPGSSIKSKRKRQSRNTPVSRLVAAEEMEPTASLADSQPAVTAADDVESRLSSVPQDIEDEPAPSAPKRGRKSSLAKQPQNPSETLLTGEEDDTETAGPSTSNRKRKRDADTESTEASKKPKTDRFVPQGFDIRLLLIRQREQLDSDEVLTDEGKGQGPLQCGLCLARCTAKDWQTHLGEHYGVGWRVGETPNVTRAWVLKTMKQYIEKSGEKITCRLCQRQLGSHTGMVVHLEGCGNKKRVECDLCKRSYSKLSFPVHRQSCSSQQKRKIETGSSFNLRLLLIRKREQLDSEEVLTEEGKGNGPLQCGLCLARTNKVKWQSHCEEHYGIGWLVGETPKNVTRSGIMLMMKAYLEESKKKLVCRLCDHRLGSALGMMLHVENCGNKQRVECEICHRSYTALTLPSHFRVCSRRQQLAETSMVRAEEQKIEDAGEKVFSNAGRAKRKSTIKAETKLKKIGEHTSGKNEFDGSDSSDYDMANDKESSEEYDSEGVDSNEDSISAEQDGSDCEKSKRSKKRTCKRRQGNLGEQAAKPLFLREETEKSSSTHKWKEFLQINYSESPLYCHFKPGYSTLSPEDAHRLLPSKESTSVRYAYGKASQDSDWQRLAPLEGFNKEGEYVGYLGGPIRQLAWVPLPSDTTDQYLLCSLRSRMKSFARHSKLKQEDGLLMLLKCTEGSSNQKSWNVRPQLHYGIRVPNGPVHSFAFLPSGGYDKATNRLGLLAVAHATSDVHIYALPLELKDEEKNDENVVIQLENVITLSLDVDQPSDEDQCTKICWSEASGHNFLATGYASGHIAFWDIGDKESINCFRRNKEEVYTFVPSNTLYLGERNIQFMELHYDLNGTRWLAVGTLVRKFLVYDILNLSQPTTLMQSTWNNIYLATFTWSPVSEAIVLSSTHYNSRAILLNPASIEFDYRTLDSTLTASRSMHTNCQQNYMVLVTDIGDLAFLDAKAITRGVHLSKTMINYRAVSTTKLQHLGDGKPNQKDVISADEFHSDYGVQINPLVEAHPQSARNCPYLGEKRLPSNPHSLALTRNNCVRCNWNSSANSWVAMGAEHGLLRILNFERNKFF
ncbi:microtubule-associated protein futsch isoform X2 [Drosophila kikkawai]|uniref:Microtubule-associated protein futsch isoform X2 n=1 Tax=Drosophila kikkawai TaxID=30033 RepID=A0A6P4I1A8_DROKI|nr:uncharacterized protein LOC108070459 [Drosophila kikkawai]